MNTTVTTTAAPQPTTAQLIAAFGSALLPLAGPAGIAVSALLPAVQQLYDTISGSGKTDYTVDDLVGIVAQGNAELAKLRANVAALP